MIIVCDNCQVVVGGHFELIGTDQLAMVKP